MKKINETFQNDWKKIEELVTAISPEIKKGELRLLKTICKSMVSNIILEIGNGINSTTHTIDSNL